MPPAYIDKLKVRTRTRVSKHFPREGQSALAAVRDVSLTVEPGELVTLLGPSGCGKTTTLRIVAGFEQPDTGRVYVDEHDVTALMVYRRSIGFVFQNYALFPHLTVFDNIAYGLRVRRLPGATVRTRVEQVLELVGLPGYGRRFPNQLSGGEQQRVAVARAVVVEPQLLLFDEPLSNLDAKLRVQMRAELSRLQRQLAITTVYVTHDQEEAMAISDRIAVMKSPGGGDYMVMWTRVLAGDDGLGRDVDMAHFTGPGDMRVFFGCGAEDLTGCLGRWLSGRSATDPELRRRADNPEARREFLRYYAMRASAAYSSGARDEWNIFVRINRKRALGDQVAMFFDGRSASPAEMETEIAPGYEVR
jgi:ABC-type nitrate/sulfonate/bicarbonate transport system ATPase subunit